MYDIAMIVACTLVTIFTRFLPFLIKAEFFPYQNVG